MLKRNRTIELERLYKNKGSDTVKKQKFFIDPAFVESYRAASLLKGQKSTITTVSGESHKVSQTVTELRNLVG